MRFITWATDSVQEAYPIKIFCKKEPIYNFLYHLIIETHCKECQMYQNKFRKSTQRYFFASTMILKLTWTDTFQSNHLDFSDKNHHRKKGNCIKFKLKSLTGSSRSIFNSAMWMTFSKKWECNSIQTRKFVHRNSGQHVTMTQVCCKEESIIISLFKYD